MNRRKFLGALGLGLIATGVPKKFFDMGLAWQRHESGLIVPKDCEQYIVINYCINNGKQYSQKWVYQGDLLKVANDMAAAGL